VSGGTAGHPCLLEYAPGLGLGVGLTTSHFEKKFIENLLRKYIQKRPSLIYRAVVPVTI
jgi:hypothetical protein